MKNKKRNWYAIPLHYFYMVFIHLYIDTSIFPVWKCLLQFHEMKGKFLKLEQQPNQAEGEAGCLEVCSIHSYSAE